MYFIVYKTTNLVTGKLYVGAHVTDTLDDGYLGSGAVLRRALKKYGADNFKREIIFECDSADEMYAMESLLVDSLAVADANFYNVKEGGFGGWDHVNNDKAKQSESARMGRKAADEVLRNKYGPDFKREIGKIGWQKTFGNMTKEEFSERAREFNKAFYDKHGRHTFEGRTHTEETKARIGRKNSKHMKGKGNPMYGKIRITDGVTNSTIDKGDKIPDGWWRGISRKNRTQ